MKEFDVCKTCGFPKSLERDIIIMDSNVLSFATYLEEQCDGCGHQKSGWTIKALQPYRAKLVKEVEARVRSECEVKRLPINWRSHKEVVQLVKSEKQETAKEIFKAVEGNSSYISKYRKLKTFEFRYPDYFKVKNSFLPEVKK